MRTTWNGSLSFGLVSLPVGLAPATKPAARQSDVSFNLLHKGCGAQIKQKRVCPVHDVELAPEEIVKGWSPGKGQAHVIVEEAELKSLESSDDSRTIEIKQFVGLDEVDPIVRDRTYYLVPGKTVAQRRPYRLLVEALNATNKGGLGRFVRSGKESLCLVRARGESLVLETLFLSEDVYSDAEIVEAATAVAVQDAELKLAEQIIDSLSAEFDPAELTSDYRGNLQALLEAKMAGQEIALPETPAEAPEPASDLLGALTASVQAVAADAKKKPAAKKPAAKKPAARKPAARKPVSS